MHSTNVGPQAGHGSGILALRGLAIALLSGVVFSLVGVIVKQMANVHQMQLAMYRFIGILTMSLPQVVLSGKVLFPKGHRTALVLRGVSGATAMSLAFVAFRYLPLGEANAIVFSAPVFVVFVARVYLKEKCGVGQVVALVLTVVWLFLIAGIPFMASSEGRSYTKEYAYGLLAAFGSMLAMTMSFVTLRMVNDVHEAIVLFTFGWVAVLVTMAISAIFSGFSAALCGLQPWMIVGLGVVSYVEQLLVTMAMQFEQAGPVTTARCATDIVLAFFWQILLFRDVPDAWSVCGAVLVSFSVVLVGLAKWISTAPPDSKSMRYLGRYSG